MTLNFEASVEARPALPPLPAPGFPAVARKLAFHYWFSEQCAMLTSKAKYALKAMIDLAAQAETDRRPCFIGDVAARQDIPRRFLENILLELRKHGLVVSHRGKMGGYALARSPDLITFADVIRAIDGPLALTPCTSRTAYRRCEDCRDEVTCALRKTLIQVRDASALILERTTLAEAVVTPAVAEPYERRVTQTS